MIIVNYKAYSQAVGEKAEELSRKCRKASKESGERVISVPQTVDISSCGGEVFSQHVDAVEPGSHTGSVLGEGLKDAGVSGTLLNHSENRIDRKEIEAAIEKCRGLGLETVVCAQTPEECRELSKLEPDFVAFEPPELIGGEKSVSSARPELIEEAVEKSEVDVLTGAGIKNSEDVEKSIELGCKGVLVASGVVKAENQYEEIIDLCEGI